MINDDFWRDLWKANDSPWHQAEPESLLARHAPPGAGKRALVPLCGKSVDLLWLMRQGFEVTGVELSEIPCRMFFEESGLPYRVEKRDGFSVFQGEHIQIWCGDFFQVPDSALAHADYLYDRAALIALPPQVREKYAARIAKLAPRLMHIIGREGRGMPDEGPPFRVDESEIRRLYSADFAIDILQSYERPSRRDPSLPVKESLYRLTPS
ncbi:MAG: thiopurine S-methyltransferase [Bacteriovoracia bacterium]